MRLSEAIRLGAAMKPQAFHTLRSKDDIATCALGAAIEACGGFVPAKGGEVVGDARGNAWTCEPGDLRFETPEEWKVFSKAFFPCPICEGEYVGGRLIPHLNDDHRWTRERIADFVELHEPLIDSVPVAEPLGEVDGISYVGVIE